MRLVRAREYAGVLVTDEQCDLGDTTAGAWNRFAIRVEGSTYTVRQNTVQVARWIDPGDPHNATRRQPSTREVPRFVGIQRHTGRVAFRNVRLRRIP